MRTSSTEAWWNKNWKVSGENKPNISAKEIKVQSDTYENGQAESLDTDDFQAKLASLEGKWKTAVPGFHEWFLKHRKVLFEESVIRSVRVNSNVGGLYYQNDIKSLHAVQKCIKEYKKRDVAAVIKNLQRLSNRQDEEEVWALYGAGNYSIAGPYKRRKQSSEWHKLGWKLKEGSRSKI